MGQNTSKSTEKYNALRMSGQSVGAKAVTVRLKDGTDVNLENVCDLYGERYLQEKDDATQLLNVIESNFDRLLRTKERRQKFLTLPKQALINILKSDDLYAANEYTLLVIVGAWVDKQISKRAAKAKKGKKSKKKKKKTKKSEEKVEEDPLVLEEKLKLKQIEEDAILAALLQDGDDTTTDLSNLVAGISMDDQVLDEETISNFLENIKDVVIPKDKSTDQYEEKLRAGIAGFAEYIRFPLMNEENLVMVMEEGLVPEEYILEALRYRALADDEEDYYKKMRANNPRFKPRSRFFTVVWDSSKKDTRLNVNKDGTVVTVVSGSGCAHKAIIGKYPITAGRGIFELTLNQRAGCYDGIGLVDPKFKVQQDHIIGVFPNSYGLGLYAGTHVATSNRRIQVPSFGAMNAGTKVKISVDMDAGTVEFFVNGTTQGKLKGLRGPLYPAMTMCEMTGAGHAIKNLPCM